MLTIRNQLASDLDPIRALNREAFAGHRIGKNAFDQIRSSCQDIVSLVAEIEGTIVGHILFSPVTVDGFAIRGMGIGELAVHPGQQRRGVGTALGRAGIERLHSAACPFVIVVGHASYYPRLGFGPGSSHGLRCQWQAIDDASFMALLLDPARMAGVSGVARFAGIP